MCSSDLAEVVHNVVATLPEKTLVNALFGDPTGLFLHMIAKGQLGLAPVVAGIVHRHGFMVFMLIEFDPAFLDVLLQQVHDADYFEFVVNFGEPIFEPEPGCIVGMPSFGVQDGFTLKSSSVLDDQGHLFLHSGIVPGEQPPVDTFPVLRRHGQIGRASCRERV